MPVVMRSVYLLISLTWTSWGFAQGLFKPFQYTPQSFKFELTNHVILVPVTINGIEFSFLLDTGVKETILFANTDDSLYLHNQSKVIFHGIGSEEGIEGMISTGNVVDVGGVAVDSLHWLYVIQGDELDIASDIGVGVNGILGSKFFNSFPLEIDYIKSRITIYPHHYDYSKEVRRYREIPIKVEGDRPYLQADIQVDDHWINGKMLLDMGNTDAFMLFAFLLPDFDIREPYVEEYIGRGFNGVIYGKRNRIRKVSLYGIELNQPIVAYPNANTIHRAKLAKDRIGSIGNQTLQRFHVFMDYGNERIYLKKNKLFRKPFLLNMAGIDLKHDGMIWTSEKVNARTSDPVRQSHGLGGEGVTIHLDNDKFQYKFILKPSYNISGIRKNSPAALAGVRPGDKLLRINGTNAGNFSLSKILDKLQSRPGEEIRLLLQRGDEEIQVRFRLTDPIPFKR